MLEPAQRPLYAIRRSFTRATRRVGSLHRVLCVLHPALAARCPAEALSLYARCRALRSALRLTAVEPAQPGL